MLDENLPVFFYKKSTEGIDHHTAIYTSYLGSEPSPVYTLKHADPSSPTSRNCYAAALFDAFNPEVLYGETLVRPDWTQPNSSQEELKRNGGIPPPPEPVRPTEFTIQLYNPDQQVVVKTKAGSWGASTSYEFSLPQTTFRLPSGSSLDRTQDDPAASLVTPKLNFVWRKESKLSKDYVCYMTGKSTDAIVKKKHRDPDIAVGLFRSLREVTLYEPNLCRVDMEDPKGLEEVLLLSAATIKDVYVHNNIYEMFSIQDAITAAAAASAAKLDGPPGQNPALPIRRKPSPGQTLPLTAPSTANGAPLTHQAHQPNQPHQPQRPVPNQHYSSASRPPPMPNARAQWELDAETARLRAHAEAEAREARRQAEYRRQHRERADEAETRRLRKMVEDEEREARRRQEAIDRETERLRREYGVPSGPPPPRTAQRPSSASGAVRPNRQPAPAPPRTSNGGMYLQPNASSYASSHVVMSGANPAPSGSRPSSQEQRVKKKVSFWGGGRSVSDDAPNTLTKKKSAMW